MHSKFGNYCQQLRLPRVLKECHGPAQSGEKTGQANGPMSPHFGVRSVPPWTFSKFQKFCEYEFPPVESTDDNNACFHPRGLED